MTFDDENVTVFPIIMKIIVKHKRLHTIFALNKTVSKDKLNLLR